jgi:hypothetical protein
MEVRMKMGRPWGCRVRCWPVALSALALSSVTLRAAAEEQPPQTALPERHGSAFVDPLGFLLFGPRAGVEVGKTHLSGGVYGRWFSPGVLAKSLFLGSNESFGFSYGVGVRGRYYLGERLNGLHLGAAVEYLHTRVENRADAMATDSNYLVPYAEGGYRLDLGRFYGDASVGLGYAARLSGSAESLPGGDPSREFSVNDESTFYGTASLDFGVFF